MSAIHPSSSLSSCSPHRLSDWSVMFVFNASLSALAPFSPILFPACWCLLLKMSAIHPSSSLSSCSHPRFSDWSVVFVFNASLSALAPSVSMPLPARLCLLLTMSAIHPSFSLSSCSHPRFSDWSVVFFFNASLSALAPSTPMSFPACWCLLLAISAIHPIFSLSSCSLVRSSDWSVMFVFNASLSVLAPSAPMPLPACWC